MLPFQIGSAACSYRNLTALSLPSKMLPPPYKLEHHETRMHEVSKLCNNTQPVCLISWVNGATLSEAHLSENQC